MRTILVDDHPIVREALRVTLCQMDPTIEIVAEASTAREAVTLVAELRPELVLMDLVMPGAGGVSATREIRRLGTPCKILVYTTLNQAVYARDALAAGADGYVPKTAPIEELRNALEELARGGRYVSPSLAPDMDDSTEAAPSGLPALSTREREIFDLILQGHSNVQLASSLFISVKTVETHRSRINKKLGVHSTGQLIRMAALYGLVST